MSKDFYIYTTDAVTLSASDGRSVGADREVVVRSSPSMVAIFRFSGSGGKPCGFSVDSGRNSPLLFVRVGFAVGRRYGRCCRLWVFHGLRGPRRIFTVYASSLFRRSRYLQVGLDGRIRWFRRVLHITGTVGRLLFLSTSMPIAISSHRTLLYHVKRYQDRLFRAFQSSHRKTFFRRLYRRFIRCRH